MRSIADYKVIKVNTISPDNTVLAQVNYKTKIIHIMRTKRTTLEVVVYSSKGVYKTKDIDFKTTDKLEEFLLYHEIRHIENRDSMRYIHFKKEIDEEIDCNLYSLKNIKL